jgi:glutaconyl-CoA/methylmalonyl-CoA decarboxylase subunit gamma
MKKLRISVNGKTYDVSVQVLEDDEQVGTGTAFLSPLPHVSAPPRSPAGMPSPLPAPGPEAGPAPAGRVIKGDPNAILAPIAGTVQKVYVQAGSRVDAKAPVVLLDAMKMDTYIYAPRAGEVSEVSVGAGDGVQVGDCLIRYKPEN